MRQIKRIILSLFFGLTIADMEAQVVVTEEHYAFTPDAYWQDVDFSDTSLVSNPEFDDRMVDFLYHFSFSDEKYFEKQWFTGVAIILEKAKVNMRVYEYALEFLLNGYSKMGKSQVVDYLLTYPMLFEGDISFEQGLRLDSITEPYQLVKVGAKAPAFVGVTIDGKPYSIETSTSGRIILVFWSTDCEYCHDFLSAIRKNLNLRTKYELVTFALADDEKDVALAVEKLRLPGYHFYDELRWESRAFLDYHVTSTPTVFVLDQNKTIVCKPYDWDELKQWIKYNR